MIANYVEVQRPLHSADLLGNSAEETTDGVYPYSFYRPIFNLSLAADYAVWGIDPLGYHITEALLTFAESGHVSKEPIADGVVVNLRRRGR